MSSPASSSQTLKTTPDGNVSSSWLLDSPLLAFQEVTPSPYLGKTRLHAGPSARWHYALRQMRTGLLETKALLDDPKGETLQVTSAKFSKSPG